MSDYSFLHKNLTKGEEMYFKKVIKFMQLTDWWKGNKNESKDMTKSAVLGGGGTMN